MTKKLQWLHQFAGYNRFSPFLAMTMQVPLEGSPIVLGLSGGRLSGCTWHRLTEISRVFKDVITKASLRRRR